ncbi:hypothetical protein NM208_g8147 [Fusarium decemcellulare]|uniref:Uncharacterized protein n=1 Tax=Fusarium decemcellulare TaxID=57161 RepID=A0ACC1S6G6_9HYPO|nr:hypothetical protein NM208_g8147 [Fusarium decemcellulare]
MVSVDEALARGKVSPEDACALFDSLPSVTPEEMIGLWKGESFDTGHPSDGQLLESGWFGKRFADDNTVDPLVFHTREGGTFPVDPRRAMALMANGAYLPDVRSQCETTTSKARLRKIEHRGVVSTGMIYNELPIIDNFRKVDENTLLGMMDNIELPGPPFFFIIRRHN